MAKTQSNIKMDMIISPDGLRAICGIEGKIDRGFAAMKWELIGLSLGYRIYDIKFCAKEKNMLPMKAKIEKLGKTKAPWLAKVSPNQRDTQQPMRVSQGDKK